MGRSGSIPRDPAPSWAWPLRLLLLVTCWACPARALLFRTPLDADPTPRVTVPTSELSACTFNSPELVNGLVSLTWQQPVTRCVNVLLKGLQAEVSDSLCLGVTAPQSHDEIQWEASQDKEQECLSKGRDNKEDEHFVMSSPPEDGKEKCPYSPTTGYTGLIVEQQMFSASRYEFRSIPDLRLSGPPVTLRTEDAPTRWLNDADFVGSAWLRESRSSVAGDDDKIYFFFTEASEETSGGRVARIARICKSSSCLRGSAAVHVHRHLLHGVFGARLSDVPVAGSGLGDQSGVGGPLGARVRGLH
ncbi:hypothetical protein CRUP_017309, partial [Coryphaenoides rupestris]